MYLDLHVHTRRHSFCSNLDPKDMVKRALRLGIDGLAIVEHHVVWRVEEIEQLKDETGAGSLVVLRGQEITTYADGDLFHGDIVTFGFEGEYPEYPSTEEIIRLVHEAGGIAIAAHPFRWGYGHGEDVYHYDFDAIEVYNINYRLLDVKKAEIAVEALGVAGTGGSDAHEAKAVGLYLTEFTGRVDSEVALINEVRARRCRPVRYEDIAP